MMNPGPVEEAGKAATSAIDALKSTPVILSLVIFNVLFLIGTFYTQLKTVDGANEAATRWKDLVEIAMKQCVPVSRP